MRFASTFSQLGVTALLLQVSNAARPLTAGICATVRATTSHKGPVPTRSHFTTRTDTVQVIVTRTPTKAITPAAQTTTTTITSTSTTETDVLKVADTFTSTVETTVTSTTDIPTVTVTSTAVTTSTTTTTLQGTTTVPTPDGFVPVQSSLPGAAAERKRSVSRNLRRSPLLFGTKPDPRKPNLSSSVSVEVNDKNKDLMMPVVGSKQGKSFPNQVDCYGYVERNVYNTYTVTLPKTKTVTVPTPTKAVSTTTSTVSTRTVTTFDASTTVTTTATDTTTVNNAPTTTFTSTSTVTATVPTYTATAYAMCSQNNIAGTIMGFGVDTANSNNNQNFISKNTAATSSTECCNNCAANPLCVTSVFEPEFPAAQQCYLIISGQATCLPTDYSLNAVINNPPLPGDGGHFISNGNCGQFLTSSS